MSNGWSQCKITVRIESLFFFFTLKVNVSPEVASRISQKVQHSTNQKFHHSLTISTKQVDSNIFNEAHDMVLKELLPLWNGFLKSNIAQPMTSDGRIVPIAGLGKNNDIQRISSNIQHEVSQIHQPGVASTIFKKASDLILDKNVTSEFQNQIL